MIMPAGGRITGREMWTCAVCARADWRLQSVVDPEICVQCQADARVERAERACDERVRRAARRGYWQGVAVALLSVLLFGLMTELLT